MLTGSSALQRRSLPLLSHHFARKRVARAIIIGHARLIISDANAKSPALRCSGGPTDGLSAPYPGLGKRTFDLGYDMTGPVSNISNGDESAMRQWRVLRLSLASVG